MASIEDLHRANIVANLRVDECIAASTRATDQAKSMLKTDLDASLAADRALYKAMRDREDAGAKYRKALMDEAATTPSV